MLKFELYGKHFALDILSKLLALLGWLLKGYGS